jgi:hypothetical protein
MSVSGFYPAFPLTENLRYCAAPSRLQRIQPGEKIGVLFPARRFGRPQTRVGLLQRLSLCFQIGVRIMVGRIQMGMPEPASNHGDVDAGSHEADGSRMAKNMRGYLLSRKRRNLLRSSFHIPA